MVEIVHIKESATDLPMGFPAPQWEKTAYQIIHFLLIHVLLIRSMFCRANQSSGWMYRDLQRLAWSVRSTGR